jgi:hypothetical protein
VHGVRREQSRRAERHRRRLGRGGVPAQRGHKEHAHQRVPAHVLGVVHPQRPTLMPAIIAAY